MIFKKIASYEDVGVICHYLAWDDDRIIHTFQKHHHTTVLRRLNSYDKTFIRYNPASWPWRMRHWRRCFYCCC